MKLKLFTSVDRGSHLSPSLLAGSLFLGLFLFAGQTARAQFDFGDSVNNANFYEDDSGINAYSCSLGNGQTLTINGNDCVPVVLNCGNSGEQSVVCNGQQYGGGNDCTPTVCAPTNPCKPVVPVPEARDYGFFALCLCGILMGKRIFRTWSLVHAG